MSDELSVLLLAVGVFAIVFTAMMVTGPPPGWACKDGGKHDFGDWQDGPTYLFRKCKKCGWKEVTP